MTLFIAISAKGKTFIEAPTREAALIVARQHFGTISFTLRGATTAEQAEWKKIR